MADPEDKRGEFFNEALQRKYLKKGLEKDVLFLDDRRTQLLCSHLTRDMLTPLFVGYKQDRKSHKLKRNSTSWRICSQKLRAF
jgi:hypothetical protein